LVLTERGRVDGNSEQNRREKRAAGGEFPLLTETLPSGLKNVLAMQPSFSQARDETLEVHHGETSRSPGMVVRKKADH